MSVSLPITPSGDFAVNASVLHSLIDNASVRAIGITAFRGGDFVLVQPAAVETPVTPPALFRTTTPTLGGTPQSCVALEVYNFLGAARRHWLHGWHSNAACSTAVPIKRGACLCAEGYVDLRDGSVTWPLHGVQRVRHHRGWAVHYPVVVLDATAPTGSSVVPVTYFGLTAACVRNDAPGHTMLPGQPLVIRQVPGGFPPELFVEDCSAPSISPGHLSGQCLGLSVGQTEALLPVEFWPYGLWRIPETGWSKYA